jgi:dolichol-phosphate mannosyltransferase
MNNVEGPIKAASVILPTYNEAANIIPLIREILAQAQTAGFKVQVVVVDDDSPDHTADLVAREFADQPGVKLVVRRGERGLASAIRRGVAEAEHEALVIMDTDFNHHPRHLAALLSLLATSHIALGSRYVPGGGMNTSRLRYWLSFLFNIMVRILLGVKTHDNLSGFIAIRRRDLLRFDQDEIFQGYGDYAIRLLYHAQQAGLTVRETPVVYEERLGGESKTQFVRTFLLYLRETWALRRGDR